ncbi:hypothetical protein Mal52_06130 [Symmachiella dynata]|uniref:Uncharacterized protein n=1 Tax=Symmachiella dynata TaxID=2527995 RepID=A0A517ZI58_9PLAN|nr:hypothetical protein Mal52_06130 [Symmachiella dynata]
MNFFPLSLWERAGVRVFALPLTIIPTFQWGNLSSYRERCVTTHPTPTGQLLGKLVGKERQKHETGVSCFWI